MENQSACFALLRRPLLAREVLDRFHALTSQDPPLFESELLSLFSDPMLLEALELASEVVYTLTLDLLEGRAVSGKQKLLMTLYKYLIRLCTRCTPFGLFAGYFTAETATATSFDFSDTDLIQKRSCLDTAALVMLKEKILAKPGIEDQLLFYPNSSLYKPADHYRYMKRLMTDQHTEFALSQAAAHPALEAVLKETEKGLYPKQIRAILQDQHLSKKSAAQYFKALVQTQILVSSLEINLTGQPYFERLRQTLQNLKGTKEISAKLLNLDQALKEDPCNINLALQQIIEKKPDFQSVQTHMRIKTKSSQISQQVLNSLKGSLSKIAPLITRIENPDLENFASRFFARYGQQKIPLLVALDYNYGVGYSKLSTQSQDMLPLLDGLSQNEQDLPNYPQASPLADALYQASLTAGNQSPVEISTQLLKQYLPENKESSLPDSFYVLGSLHRCSPKALDDGDYLFDLKALSGPSATNLLTRFCQGDSELTEQVQKLIEDEESLSREMIFAEIAHFPDLKAANILQRPAFRRYELAYLSAPAGGLSQTIGLDDVLVSCADGKNIILTSSSLQKQIMPTLSSAHNFSSGLPVYRFLCDLASAPAKNLYWDWGAIADQPFLPRVNFEKLVISKASWKLGPKELASLEALKTKANNEEIQTKTNVPRTEPWDAVRKRLRLPRYFTAGSGDRTLLIDSEHKIALDLLCQMLKKEDTLRVTEYLDQPGQGLLKAQDMHFSNEIIIPFTRPASTDQPLSKTISKQNDPKTSITRSFALTSPWLYVKIYGSQRLTDSVLTSELGPLCEKLERNRVIDKWFFIRYKDPDHHIRLRFHSNKKDFWVLVLKALDAITSPLLKNGTLHSVQTDTYQREIERYPPVYYEQIESIFHADSKAILQCLSRLPFESDAEMRWQLAIKGADMLLNDFGLDLQSKIALIENVHAQFAAELDSSGKWHRVIDQNYRQHKDIIAGQLQTENLPGIDPLSTQLKKRSKQVSKILAVNPGEENHKLQKVLADLIHMSLNRWFHSEQRSQEFVVYHYLKKYYCTLLKNNKTEKLFLQVVGCNQIST